MSRRPIAVLFLVAGVWCPGSALAQQPSPSGAGEDGALAAAVRAIEDRREALVALRHDLHRHPEPSGEEERTARVVAERLRALGLEVRTGVGGHGVVGVLHGEGSGRVVAYRADMDAMRSTAPDPAPYRSVVEGVRHICGHDVHTAVAVALAEGLAAAREHWTGTVVFVFQPAEENATGARAMLADEVFGSLRPEAIYGLHAAPLPVGRLATRAGVMMPGRDRVTVTLTGGGDLDAGAATAAAALAELITVPPAASGAPRAPEGWVSGFVSQPEAEETVRVVRAQLTIPDQATRDRVRERLVTAMQELDRAGFDGSLEIEPRAIAGVDNHAAITERAVASVERALLGSAGDASPVLRLETLIPAFSEDFGSFQQVVPGAFFFLGVSNPEQGIVGMPHSPGFVADDRAIVVGARAMAAVVLDELRR